MTGCETGAWGVCSKVIIYINCYIKKTKVWCLYPDGRTGLLKVEGLRAIQICRHLLNKTVLLSPSTLCHTLQIAMNAF